MNAHLVVAGLSSITPVCCLLDGGNFGYNSSFIIQFTFADMGAMTHMDLAGGAVLA
jgi:hypothetical protein